MRYFGIVRTLTIGLGALSAVTLARQGFAFFLTDFFTAIVNTAETWLALTLGPLEWLIHKLLAYVRELGFAIPAPREHWRHILVLMSLLIGSYVRANASAQASGRTIFLAVWGGLCALLASVLAGMVQFDDLHLFYWPAIGFFVFIVSNRAWAATFDRREGVGWIRTFGVSGVLSLVASSLLTALALDLWTIRFLVELNGLAVDALPSPAMALLAATVAILGALLALAGLPERAPVQAGGISTGGGPGRRMGLNILFVLGFAAIIVGANRLIVESDITAGGPCTSDCPLNLPKMIPITFDKTTNTKLKNKFSLSETEITQRQFAEFVDKTGYRVDGKCNELTDKTGSKSYAWAGLVSNKVHDWNDPFDPKIGESEAGYDPSHPVVCVSLHDARAYTRWLRDKTHLEYRLPTDEEWVYAAWAGPEPVFETIEDATFLCKYGNFSIHCNDSYEFTAPVASFPPYKFGLYDMLGNVWEWTETCSDKTNGADSDGGQPWILGICSARVIRGGSWDKGVGFATGSRGNSASYRFNNMGFRVARTNR